MKPTRADLADKLIHLERELRGERALRRGWEQDARLLLEENRKLRAENDVLRAELEGKAA